MKNVLLAAATILLAGTAPAQTLPAANVPAAARATFKARFPTVKNAVWEKESDAFEAGFRQNGKAVSAVITAAGVLRETETTLPAGQLPAAVRAALARDYQAYQLTETAAIVRADGRTVYEAEVRRGGKSQDVLFTADGKVISQ